MKVSPIVDVGFPILKKKQLNISASTDLKQAITGSTIRSLYARILMAQMSLTSTVEGVISNILKYAPNALIIVKSTLPVGLLMT